MSLSHSPYRPIELECDWTWGNLLGGVSRAVMCVLCAGILALGSRECVCAAGFLDSTECAANPLGLHMDIS